MHRLEPDRSGAILLGLRLHRPASRWAWRLLAAYCLCTAAGNTIWIIYEGVLHVDPFPSPGDAFFLGGYVVEATGLLLLIRRRNPGRDLAAFLDAAIVATGFGVASWVFLMAPLAHDPSLALDGKTTSLGYRPPTCSSCWSERACSSGRRARSCFSASRCHPPDSTARGHAVRAAEPQWHVPHRARHRPADPHLLRGTWGPPPCIPPCPPSHSRCRRSAPASPQAAWRCSRSHLCSRPAVLLGQILSDHLTDLVVTAIPGQDQRQGPLLPSRCLGALATRRRAALEERADQREHPGGPREGIDRRAQPPPVKPSREAAADGESREGGRDESQPQLRR